MWKCNCGEMNSNNSSYCQLCGDSQERAIYVDDVQREDEQKKRIHISKINNLIDMGIDGYYEYKVVNLRDDNAGGIYSSTIESRLNELGLEGWRLKCAYTNELGKNSNSGGYGGISTGTNATIDDNILIFERFVKIEKQ